MNSKQIRQAFLDFFAQKQHKIVPSAPLVPKDDASLMFINSGMAPFKDYFLGNRTPETPRIADTQKCLRVSGKHNDLEDVGFDGTHHTLFEMLGNWSFGDYFKQEAIAWSWELLTSVYGLPKDRLYATVFGGDSKEKLESDEEARNFWRKYLPDNHILDGSKKDNFWEMGAQGPCGPCSEIHFDFRSDEEREKTPGENLVNQDHPSVVEIWNNVFIQFERKADGSLVSLPAKHVDTGMGFERLCMILQNKKYTYDTDVFTPFIEFIERASGKKYTGSYERTALSDVAMRVIADHLRAVAFTIADGQLPSSSGAGYVIRRILRRAVRYYYSFLGIKEPFLQQLVPLLASEFGAVFPEIKAQQDFIQKVIQEEERSFLRTLEGGLRRLDAITSKNQAIDGQTAFELYDTFGFPIDLTALIAKENGLDVDMDGFEKALAVQKERSRADAQKQVGDWVSVQQFDNNVFVGYDDLEVTDAQVMKYRIVKAKGAEQYQIVLNKTPFYAESGGQCGDVGVLWFGLDSSAGGEVISVLDTQKDNDLILHIVSHFPANMNGIVTAQVDASKRRATSQNHSAVHLMHAALHQVLGKHALQKGQDVDSKHLRFDFSHFQKVSESELQNIEQIVNQKIRENIALLEQRNVPIEIAKQSGAMMLFGEKYGESVRMITFDKNFSQELCGGTHVKSTGEIGYFKLLSESALAAGVRRIEAVTGIAAEHYINQQLQELQAAKAILKNHEIVKAVQKMQDEHKFLQKEVERLLNTQANLIKKDLQTQFTQLKDINLLAAQVDLANQDALKTLAYQLEQEKGNALVILGAIVKDLPFLMVVASKELAANGIHAGNIVRELAKEIQGGGGGQAFFATAGGKDVSGLARAIEKGKNCL